MPVFRKKAMALLDATDDASFNERQIDLIAFCESRSNETAVYLSRYWLPKVVEKIWNRRHILDGTLWSNNNNESINHALKASVDWKAKKLPDLINTLSNYVESMCNDLRKALIGVGDFILVERIFFSIQV